MTQNEAAEFDFEEFEARAVARAEGARARINATFAGRAVRPASRAADDLTRVAERRESESLAARAIGSATAAQARVAKLLGN